MSPARNPAESQPVEAHWREAWTSALHAVEVDVAAAETLLDRLHAGDEPPEQPPASEWIAPALLGHIPAEFADRARLLLQRQVEVSERLASAMVQARSQQRALTMLEPPERRPVFVDTAV
ncbi:hypothetical protein GTQ99_04615 [Kineococcus sp. T13]|uniref:hypothetical protein n=1 Tax=Kineococcus vitellinus TaxID=2696565 RepID=UPI001411F498|nr:hypothetical protein [Kineococcus vitellinus]NAZ74706.1 hypothetical protein [Kineococcus vitellinus]